MREDDVQIRRVTQTDASPASGSHTLESLWEVIHISDVKGMIFPYDRALTLARNIAQMQAVDIYKLLDRWLRTRIGRVMPENNRLELIS
jgi:hypothetical protein